MTKNSNLANKAATAKKQAAQTVQARKALSDNLNVVHKHCVARDKTIGLMNKKNAKQMPAFLLAVQQGSAELINQEGELGRAIVRPVVAEAFAMHLKNDASLLSNKLSSLRFLGSTGKDQFQKLIELNEKHGGQVITFVQHSDISSLATFVRGTMPREVSRRVTSEPAKNAKPAKNDKPAKPAPEDKLVTLSEGKVTIKQRWNEMSALMTAAGITTSAEQVQLIVKVAAYAAKNA